jgi:hypothetical protein
MVGDGGDPPPRKWLEWKEHQEKKHRDNVLDVFQAVRNPSG